MFCENAWPGIEGIFITDVIPQREKRQVEETLEEVREKEEEMSQANKALLVRLENVQVSGYKDHTGRTVSESMEDTLFRTRW